MSATFSNSSPVSVKRYRGCCGSCSTRSAWRRIVLEVLPTLNLACLMKETPEPRLLACTSTVTKRTEQLGARKCRITKSLRADKFRNLFVCHGLAVKFLQL